MSGIDLAEFLLARIAEDVAAYRDAPHMGCVEDDGDGPDVIHSATCPNRVLAECEAKRRIVELHGDLNADWHIDEDDSVMAVCTTCEDRNRHDAAAWPCPTLRLLALPYADHPDYRSEWAP